MKIQDGCLYIPCAEGMRNIDRYCAEKLGIPVYELMQNSGTSVADFICHVAEEKRFIPSETKTVILCGTGNNGGDGYAAAEILFARGFDVTLIMALGKPPKNSDGNVKIREEKNNSRTESRIGAVPCEKTSAAYAFYEKCALIPLFALHESDGSSETKLTDNKKIFETISSADIIVDAVFGTGTSSGTKMNLDTEAKYGTKAKYGTETVKQNAATNQHTELIMPRPLPKTCCELFLAAECTNAVKIAVDIPSGLDCDTGYAAENAFRADFTLTLHLPKMGLYINKGQKLCGKITVADIGIPYSATAFSVEKFGIRYYAANRKLLSSAFPARKSDSHKGTFGRLLFLCGGYSQTEQPESNDFYSGNTDSSDIGSADIINRNTEFEYTNGASMTGAPYLALLAALRCGAGLCELMSEKEIVSTIQSRLSEPIFSWYGRKRGGYNAGDFAGMASEIQKSDVILCGCGLGNGMRSEAVVYNLVSMLTACNADILQTAMKNDGGKSTGGHKPCAGGHDKPYRLVLDADALNIISRCVNAAKCEENAENAEKIENAENAEKIENAEKSMPKRDCKARSLPLDDPEKRKKIVGFITSPPKNGSVRVMTPHPLELARLLGTDIETILKNRLESALKAAKRFYSIVVLKGQNTITASPDGRVIVNTSGGPGLAKGGSGDVLAGIISALIAVLPEHSVYETPSQCGLCVKEANAVENEKVAEAKKAVEAEKTTKTEKTVENEKAAETEKTVEAEKTTETEKILTATFEKTAAAVYLHGLAGDLLTKKVSEYGVLPSELPMAAAEIIASLVDDKKQDIS